jgi:pyruvate/2-oxoglutarate dehydrogenase complex dihydrolipoamide dehydrogenase (E3) component
VALVEKHLLGGDCLNYGCVPSKAIIRAARAWADVRDAGSFGIEVPPGTRVKFETVMERMRRLRASLSLHDSAARFRDLGVDVYLGEGRFTGAHQIEVGGTTLSFKKACIATGARAMAPPIPGLAEAGYQTNETLFSLTTLPGRMAVIGAGPICCEMAQTFARFGSRVTLLQSASRILPRDDPDAVAVVRKSLETDGIRIVTGAKVTGVSPAPGGKKVRFEAAGRTEEVEVDEVLVGVGRAPNVEGLGLEAAGVRFDKSGVKVDDRLRTSNRDIYAAGDICSPYQFTHLADAMARIVIGNALFHGRGKASALTIPWCTYTDPEVAHVGLHPQEAKERGHRVREFVQEFRDIDRAILDGDPECLAKVWVEEGTDRILGASLVAPHAGEMIGEIGVAMTNGLGLKAIARTIHAYPTQAEVWKRIADAYQRTRLTPLAKKVLSLLMGKP